MRSCLTKLPVRRSLLLIVMAVTGGPHWPGQEKQIPLELVERIGHHLDGMSLISLAATDSFMRKAAHHVAVLRLDSLAQEHPDLAASLARMGCTKTAAAKHKPATCPESEKANTFRIARFFTQKLSG